MEPQAAMMFQRAPPEVNGFGVMTWIPDLVRSVQVLMCLGLPLRTTRTAIELVTMPRNASLFQLALTSPALTSVSTSVASDRWTTSAGRPEATARACEPEAPNDWVKVTSLPAGVAWNAGMSLA